MVIKFHNTALMDFLYVSRDKNVLGAIRMATNYDIHTEVKIEPYKVLYLELLSTGLSTLSEFYDKRRLVWEQDLRGRTN